MEAAAVGAQTGRPGSGPVRTSLAGRTSPAALFSANLITANAGWACAAVRLLLRLRRRNSFGLCGRRLDPHQGFGFATKLAEFLVVGVVFFHPLHRLLVPLAGLILVAELPASHGQEEQAVTGGRLLQMDGLFQGRD